MAAPSLRLAFLKCPRDGDTLQYKSGSTIRVGRIVRGNEIAVKDAGISTKHLRIESVSGNWVISDLGSSNGTLLNSDSLNPDTPVNLRHGDIIELGEYTSISVNFVIDVVQEQNLPPRGRRNDTRQVSADLDNVGLGKRTRVSNLGNCFEEEEFCKPSSRVRKARKIENTEKLGIFEEEKGLLDVKKGNYRVRRARNVVASVQSSCVNSIKLETEDAKDIEIVEKSCLGVVNVDKDDMVALGDVEEGLKEKRVTRATRSKKNEIVGDSYLDLEMDTDAREEDRSCPVEEDMKNEQGTVVEMDLGKMTLGEWFGFLEVHWPKQINQETESMIEPMPSKTQRVCEYIAEQREVQAKA
ncbi:unnamed protein product [Arabis nemorensis]|uniref:FHA domain-containing protein n=1 Tax=Arabis nemorensis TaxID=586526 RepID=A0A565BIZ3_9BRAS|nr:unnamed protein product [Arabis nemorensis]